MTTKTALTTPSLFYDPPYERPLEDEFLWHLVKYLRPITGLRYQAKVETPASNAWIDFVVELGARRVGFEITQLDGEDNEEIRLRGSSSAPAPWTCSTDFAARISCTSPTMRSTW